MKPEAQNKARELRSQGMAIKQIAKELGVSQSSVSLWVRDIALTEEQTRVLEQQNPIYNRQIHGSKARAQLAREQRKQYQQEGRDEAKKGNLLHQAGCMLYWAEGSKDRRNCVFTNSDVEMSKMFVRFLRETLNVPDSKILISVNCYTTNGLSKEQIEQFWLATLDLPSESLRKGQENNRPRSVTNAVRHNKLIYGMCSIIVHSVAVVQHIYGAIQEYGGFDNDYMLM